MTSAADDIWVFGYASLIWRPDFAHTEERRARLHGFHRDLCVYSVEHRGTVSHPGLVFGMDRGGSCDGVALRVPAANAGPPGVRASPKLVATGEGLLLHGGHEQKQVHHDTWVFRAGRWTRRRPLRRPPALSWFSLTYDEGREVATEPVQFTIVRPGETVLPEGEPETLVAAQ